MAKAGAHPSASCNDPCAWTVGNASENDGLLKLCAISGRNSYQQPIPSKLSIAPVKPSKTSHSFGPTGPWPTGTHWAHHLLCHRHTGCCISGLGHCLTSGVTWGVRQHTLGSFNQQTCSWLVVSTPLKNISQWEGLSHILWKIKNV